MSHSGHANSEPSITVDTNRKGSRKHHERWARFSHDRLSIVGLVLLSTIFLVSLFGPPLVPHDPVKMEISARFQPPSAEHWFGTDHLGRDMFVRVLEGGRISIVVAVVVSLLSAAVGLILGALAGYLSGTVDEIIMRVTDVFLSFPWLIFAMAVALVFGPSLWNAMLALSLIWWPAYARIVRGQVLASKEKDYVQASRALGGRDWRVLVRHILPNSMGPYIVVLTVGAGRVILSTSTLSFVGLGAQPPTPEWGVLIASGRDYLFDSWWITTFPGIAILLTVVGFNLVGDGLRDLLDPTS